MTEKYKIDRSMRKVSRLNEHLEKRFGLSLDLDSRDHLLIVQEHYRQKRQFILTHYGLTEALSREDYAKAVMISEAISLFLREISPARTIKRTRKDNKK